MRDESSTSAEMTSHEAKHFPCNVRIMKGQAAEMGRTRPPDHPKAMRLVRLLSGKRRTKKLPNWANGEQAIAENLAYQPTEDGATDDRDAKDDENDAA